MNDRTLYRPYYVYVCVHIYIYIHIDLMYANMT